MDIIEEGISEFFCYNSSPKHEPDGKFTDKDFFKILGDLGGYYVYDAGYCLVKPILEKHGVNGIKYLLKNPLKVEDLNDLPAYRSRVLSELAKINSN